MAPISMVAFSIQAPCHHETTRRGTMMANSVRSLQTCSWTSQSTSLIIQFLTDWEVLSANETRNLSLCLVDSDRDDWTLVLRKQRMHPCRPVPIHRDTNWISLSPDMLKRSSTLM